jgi:hypothetical protein
VIHLEQLVILNGSSRLLEILSLQQDRGRFYPPELILLAEGGREIYLFEVILHSLVIWHWC